MTAYDLKLQRVCTYIQHHLDDELSLQVLSDVAGLSRFHFHRIFAAHLGISVMKYRQMLRLKRASFRLAFNKDIKVIEIALDSGFDSPEAFTRAFKRSFDQTPRAFRTEPNWQNWHMKFVYFTPKSELDMNVNIIERPLEKIAYISHRGSPEKVFETAAKFIEWRKRTGLSPVRTSATYGIPFSDPEQTPEQEFRFDIAGSINKSIDQNDDGIEMGEIPAGRYAMVRHLGSHDQIRDSVYFLFRNWLPEHQEEAGDYPVFFHYHNFVHEVNEADLITDIYLLLK
ncbi:helix-turn-helix domain-containing protein [Acinetobacter guerrae]|uniref:Helix-turn-helix domain-containing protein n=1 Tax=Acinetobacter guerrae TaxID=1843371 RepID=A0A3A8EKS6_9GAMM|nr:AraC family transcriptional regulator [Acinetobacter guerrae]RKG35502.1 helix-turn-helix domain-containing protein [Acinetobacter guerrae]